MQDPYITSAGITYEKEALLQHINTNGLFDPFTREQISKEKVYPNIAIRNEINTFLQSNPWAFQFNPNEDFLEIDL